VKVPVQVHEYVLQERLEIFAGFGRQASDIEVSDVEFHLPQPLYTITPYVIWKKRSPG
jgi:hypothetical protein